MNFTPVIQKKNQKEHLDRVLYIMYIYAFERAKVALMFHLVVVRL